MARGNRSHGAEKIDHFVIKCMVEKAAHSLVTEYSGNKGTWVEPEKKLKEPLRDYMEDPRTVDVLIHWTGFKGSHNETYVEVQRDMDDKDFREKIDYYVGQGYDYEIIPLSRVVNNYEKDYQMVRDIIEGHIPRRLKNG